MKRRGIEKITFWALIFYLVMGGFHPIQVEALAGKTPNILIINSYEQANPWTQMQEKGLESGLKENGVEAKIFHEYLDSKRIHGGNYLDAYTKYLIQKYENTPVDLIVTTDDYATLYVNSYKNQLVSEETPVIFSGVNDLSFKSKNFVGVYEKVDIKGTIELINEIQGNDVPITIVTDQSLSSDSIIKTSLPDKDYLDNHHVRLLQNAQLTAVKTALNNQKEGAILFLLFNEDSDNNSYTYFEGLAEIQNYSDLPTYVVWDFYMDKSVMGGSLITESKLTKDLSYLATRVLAGEPLESVGSLTTEAEKQLNYVILNRYGLVDKAKSTQISMVNEPNSFFETYSQLITVVITLTVIFVIIVFLLVNSIRQKTRYYGAIGEYKNEMLNTNQKLEKRIGELNETILQTEEDLNQAIIMLMAYKRKAIFADRVPDILHEVNLGMANIHAMVEFMQNHNERFKRFEASAQLSHVSEYADHVDETLTGVEMTLQGVVHLIGAVRTGVGDNSEHERNYKILPYLESVWAIIKPSLKKKKVSLQIKVPEEISLYGNPNDMITILTILIGNAIRHGYATFPERSLKLEIEAYSGTNQTTIVFRDDGIGCPTEKLESALIQKSDPRHLIQSGLGLYQLRLIVEEKMKGHVNMTGDVDEGVQVRITIPKAGV